MSERPNRIPAEVAGLSRGVDAPDLSDSILREVGRRRAWLNSRQRRLVFATRCAAGFALIGAVAATLLIQRYTDIDEALAPEPRPLADLVQNVRDETSSAVQSVSTRVRSIPERLVTQSQAMVTARVERLEGRRVFELDSPVLIVDEMHASALMPLGDDAAGRFELCPEDLLGGPMALQWERGPGNTVRVSWPTALSVPEDARDASR